MDALTFDVCVWVGATGDAGDGVDGLIRLKPQIQFCSFAAITSF